MFRIGEFSKITQVSIRMLRYYDENKLLEPAKVDQATGYRMYSSNQIEKLNRILFLKNLGFSVGKITEFLDDWEIENIREKLEVQKEEIKQTIIRENEKLVRLQASLRDLERQNIDLNTQIMIKSLPSCHVLSLRKIVPDYFCEGELWKELSRKILDLKETSTFSIYHDREYKEQDVDIEVCVTSNDATIVDKSIIGRQVKDVLKAACFMVYGPYENISIAYKEFAFWLEQHPEYKMCGENRQVCHIGEWNETNRDNYVTELQIPIQIII